MELLKKQYGSCATSRIAQKPREFGRRNLSTRQNHNCAQSQSKHLSRSSHHAISGKLTPRVPDEVSLRCHSGQERAMVARETKCRPCEAEYNSARSQTKRAPTRIFIRRLQQNNAGNRAAETTPLDRLPKRRDASSETLRHKRAERSPESTCDPRPKGATNAFATNGGNTTDTPPNRARNAKPITVSGNIVHGAPNNSSSAECRLKPAVKSSLSRLRELVKVRARCKSKESPGHNQSMLHRTNESSQNHPKSVLKKLVGAINNIEEILERPAGRETTSRRGPKSKARSERNASLELPDDSNYLRIVSFVEEIKSSIDLKKKLSKHSNFASTLCTSRIKQCDKTCTQDKAPLSCRSFLDEVASTGRRTAANRIRKHRQASLNIFSKLNNYGNHKSLNRIESSPHRLMTGGNGNNYQSSRKDAETFQQELEGKKADLSSTGKLPLPSLSSSRVKFSKKWRQGSEVKHRRNVSVADSLEKADRLKREEVGNVNDDQKLDTERGHNVLKVVLNDSHELDFAELRKVLHVQEGEIVNLRPKLFTYDNYRPVQFSVHGPFFADPEL